MVRRRRLATVRRAHLKFVGIERKTQRRYNKAVEKFFFFCTFFHGSQPSSGEELNFLLSEFVNHLWQDDEPYQNAFDTVAAVRRYLPTYRSHTSTAQAYLRNWGRTRTVRRALSLPLSALLGIVGHAALYKDWATAAACYIGLPLLVARRGDPHAQGTARGPLRRVSQIGPVPPGQQGSEEERCVGVCVGPRPGRKTAPADHDGREEFGRLRLRAHVGLSCTWSSRVGSGGGHPWCGLVWLQSPAWRRHVPFHTVRFPGCNYVLWTLAARRHGTKIHLSGSSCLGGGSSLCIGVHASITACTNFPAPRYV